jgi:hypothetical protein
LQFSMRELGVPLPNHEPAAIATSNFASGGISIDRTAHVHMSAIQALSDDFRLTFYELGGHLASSPVLDLAKVQFVAGSLPFCRPLHKNAGHAIGIIASTLRGATKPCSTPHPTSHGLQRYELQKYGPADIANAFNCWHPQTVEVQSTTARKLLNVALVQFLA